MKYVISIINPEGLDIMTDICDKLGTPLTLSAYGHGTASRSMLDILGIESNEKRIVVTAVNDETVSELIRHQQRRLFIDAPGNGITVCVPIKSVAGGKTLSYLNGEEKITKKAPEINSDFELVVAIANKGHTDTVMDAAREVGARGGTVIHAKGTGSKSSEKFFKVSLANEREMILIVASSAAKSDIMKNIVSKAGPSTEAGTVVFSLPVSEVAGFGITSQIEPAEG